ncbi:MAG: NAD-dependent epimerase/dehydratase family protein [Nitrososphaeria archaeon]
MSKYIITGGAGFIGSNLVKDLADKGHQIIVVDNMHTGSKELLKGVDAELYQMTVYDFFKTGKWKNVDGIYHLGKPSASPMYRENREKMIEFVRDSVAVLEMVKELGVKMVAASTSSVYNGLPPPHREDMIINPTDFYTEVRIFEERTAQVYENLYGIRWNEMRFFSVYGPGEEFKKGYANLITQFLWAALKNERPVIYGDGTQRRDFIYVGDVVNALELAMSSSHNGVYNVGTGISYSLNEVVKMLEEELMIKINPLHIPNPVKNYVMVTQASIEKAERDLAFKAKVNLREGIKKIAEYYMSL